MGHPVSIYTLASDLIRLSGYEPEKDIKIKITGLRPGEKLSEELFLNDENIDKTTHKKIFVVKSNNGIENFNIKLENLINIANESQDEELLRELVFSFFEKSNIIHDTPEKNTYDLELLDDPLI